MRYYFAWVFIACTFSSRAQTDVNRFLSGLDSIRKELKIPAMSAAAQKGNTLLFDTAFGYSDVEHHIKASPRSVFRIASVTKTFTSTLVMQLVEQGKLNIDAPISQYGLELGDPDITVKNLLTHTSEGIPGTAFQYNGYRYGLLGPVIEKASGKPFYQLLMENIILSLGMSSTAPGISLDQYFQYSAQDKRAGHFFQAAFSRLARPYGLNSKGELVAIEYLNEFGAFGGLATTASDLLKYSDAIDRHWFVTEATQKRIFTPNRISGGTLTPYGLGWFVQSFQGIDFYWHYGQTQGESALFIKVPQLKLALAVLCNSDKLSQPFPLGDGDLFTSPVGQLFYRCFVNNGAITDQSFQNKEMIAGATMALLNGNTAHAQEIYKKYARINFIQDVSAPENNVVAAIREVGINKDITIPFSLKETTRLGILGVGENCSADLNSWCDYGWIEDGTGKLVWQMQGQPTQSGGGARKNQKVVQEISLPAGSYILRYKSDSGHAFNSWDSLPPNDFFWGIILYDMTK